MPTRAARRLGPLTVAAVAVLAGCGSSHRTTAGSEPSTIATAVLAQVQARVLVNGAGYALYMFVPDHEQRVTCTALCAESWPPVFADGTHPPATTAGVVPALVGTDPDPAGGRVVTYNHWPLYTYAADPQPGVATGQGLDLDGGYWYLIRPDGSPIVPPGEPAATGPAAA